MSINKKILCIGSVFSAFSAMYADDVRVMNVQNNNNAIVISVTGDASRLVDTITLNKASNGLVRKQSDVYAELNVDDSNSSKVKVIDNDFIVEVLPNGDIALSGTQYSICEIASNGKVLIEAGKTLIVENDLLLRGASSFDVAGTLDVRHDLATIISAFNNTGKVKIARGWQDMALRTFTNAARAEIAMQRMDFLSPAVTVNNSGSIACVSDFNGVNCNFNNLAGALFSVGGNCNIRQLVNKSATEPQISAYVNLPVRFLNPAGAVVPNPNRHLVNGTHTEGDNTPNRGSLNGYKKVDSKAQNFSRREGAKSNVYVAGSLTVMAGNSLNNCSDILVGGNLVVASGDFSNCGFVTMLQETKSTYNCDGGHRQDVERFLGVVVSIDNYWTYTFKYPQQTTTVKDSIFGTTLVLGNATGTIRTLTNGAADNTRQATARATQNALNAKMNELRAFAERNNVSAEIDWDPAEYNVAINAMRANPTLTAWAQQQAERNRQSLSSLPSRRNSFSEN